MRQTLSANQPSTETCDPEFRYHWTKPSDLPDRVELVDRVTRQAAAVILIIERRCQWKRITSQMIHGAPPAEGKCNTLGEAKAKVLDGLKNEM